MRYESLLVLLVALSAASAYSGGAPVDTCEDMTPKHPKAARDSKTFPYKVSINSNEIKKGEKAEITISGGDFKGFLLQVRDGDKPVGAFNIPDHHRYAKTIDCSGNMVRIYYYVISVHRRLCNFKNRLTGIVYYTMNIQEMR